ncbi:MFS transporter [Streptococcus oricebi]|uniref:MFS transporter n=1 Tax=Streptococcus oricebi TaxID=1547447 RepID=A0ABS5B5C1_9STRE|nr:MFS transporter [Streptococcus oricebi]MBP2623643.1 MFS transporter [Streptococcus oricebi]
MKKFMEKVSILGLSTILTTSFSISSALPAMSKFYKSYPASQLELLVSLPSIGIIIMLVLNAYIERYLSERQMIVTGLSLLSLSGFVPLFTTNYWLIFASRLVFGLGVGLMNAKAISIISDRYQGRERLQMLGYRSSAEVVGTALLTLAVGQLLHWGWQASFLIYGAGFPILLLYLLFVSKPEARAASESLAEASDSKLRAGQLKIILFLSLLAGVIVLCNTTLNIRIPSLLIKNKLGQEETASLVLGAMQFTGVVAGISFASLAALLKERLLLVAGLSYGLAQILLGLSSQLWFLGFMSVAAGFSYSVSLTAIFNLLSDFLPADLINRGTSIIILGCSLGASSGPFILLLLGVISDQVFLPFVLLGALMILATSLIYPISKKMIREREGGQVDASR